MQYENVICCNNVRLFQKSTIILILLRNKVKDKNEINGTG